MTENAKIILDIGVEVEIMNQGKCRSCGQSVNWCKTKSGKLMPVDPDLKNSHFKTCPQAGKWRKKEK